MADYLDPRRENGKRGVMIVDDHPDSADMLCEAFETVGYKAKAAYDGVAALSVARQFRPDVVVLDIGLPQLTGLEVAHRLRDVVPDVIIIALSGYGSARNIEDARNAGILHYLLKPVDLAALLRLVHSLCR